MLYNIFLVALGGAIGSVMRFSVSEIFIKSCKGFEHIFGKFPVGTFTVNVVGSMFAGIAYYFIIRNFDESSSQIKHFFLTGILGGFTTFSAFSLDFFRLFNSGNVLIAVGYAFLSIFLSVSILAVSFHVTKIIFP
ncbi:MAG: CrcB family protein [Alphaproteobacteria bacterium]|nr:CrcB family protein [Alphaproteobacteria bacterium]